MALIEKTHIRVCALHKKKLFAAIPFVYADAATVYLTEWINSVKLSKFQLPHVVPNNAIEFTADAPYFRYVPKGTELCPIITFHRWTLPCKEVPSLAQTTEIIKTMSLMLADAHALLCEQSNLLEGWRPTLANGSSVYFSLVEHKSPNNKDLDFSASSNEFTFYLCLDLSLYILN